MNMSGDEMSLEVIGSWAGRFFCRDMEAESGNAIDKPSPYAPVMRHANYQVHAGQTGARLLLEFEDHFFDLVSYHIIISYQ